MVAIAACVARASLRRAVLLGVALAAGLLTKAYFLAFVPLCIGAVAWQIRRRKATKTDAALFLTVLVAAAGPWYARNIILHGNLSGTQEAEAGIGPSEVAVALARMPLLKDAWDTALHGLWMGNNHFTTFSHSTLVCMFVLLAAALALYARRRPTPAEIAVLLATASYAAALAYAAGTAFVMSRGETGTAAAWYLPPLLIPALLLAVQGCAAAGRAGRGVLAALVLLFAYVMAATYWVKLIPLYGGFGVRPAQWRDLLNWYGYGEAGPGMGLDMAAPGSPAAIRLLAALVGVSAVVLSLTIIYRLARSRELFRT
jgi:hypothetical protein